MPVIWIANGSPGGIRALELGVWVVAAAAIAVVWATDSVGEVPVVPKLCVRGRSAEAAVVVTIEALLV
jgi:hypothetical protein